MKFFSFKIFILCILLPPVLYIFSIQYTENHLRHRYADEIEEIYIGDTGHLFDGSLRLKDAIEKNIDLYIQSKPLISWGVNLNVTVITKRGKILYPPVFEEEFSDPLRPPDLMEIAADNYRLMNEGPEVVIDLKIGHNTLFSNVILFSYILIVLLVLYFYYRAGVRKLRQAESEKAREIDRLLEQEKNHFETLKSLEREREKLSSESARIKKTLENEKVKASRNEDEMIEEIVALEEKFKKNLALQNEQQEEINTLKEEIKRLEKGGRKESKPKIKDSDAKRFRALYKNLSINERAISGFAGLSDDLKIKGEEIIHQLNENPDIVTIKRKVFGKKSRHTILEVIFGYKGRLYFSRSKDNKIEVLTIGTKNSQTKDLEFLDNLTLK
ncbi:hypothetical protein [Desulfonema magnum]|uniref:Uncharacterized protein n=1 Tax=Desulfonema magnum TaxID=45655 RepID=A0A975BID0_9BACT|nr:hypothetical protein [Desulfonema magnum]QTA85941.1 Uncharacterized protein dnm_019580 [Desulfonema magnum]